MTRLTSSSLNIPKLASAFTGIGVPKSISVISVEIILPPHPFERAVLRPCVNRESASASIPIVVRSKHSAISLSMPLGTMPHFFHLSWVFWGALFIKLTAPLWRPKSSINFRATSFATSFTGLPSNSILRYPATLYSFFTSFI